MITVTKVTPLDSILDNEGKFKDYKARESIEVNDTFDIDIIEIEKHYCKQYNCDVVYLQTLKKLKENG